MRSHLPTNHYHPKIQALIESAPEMPLGPGTPNATAHAALQALTLEQAFEGKTLRHRTMAGACLSGLWLLHNYLDESHTISQDDPSITGSFLHGIMHRREPDASNSAYWFRKVGRHPIFDALRHAVAQEGLGPDAPWDPFAFIDRCEQARDSNAPEEQRCIKIQQIEWSLLFEYCHRAAIE